MERGRRRTFIAPVRDDEALNLSLDGWEGPLDLLLNLARAQKVDLHAISILALVEQYLTYLEQAKALRLEIAADYLVMAAWLAYLKSCLLLPKDPTVDPIARGTGAAAPASPAAARRDARGRRAADGPRPARPRRLRARRARGAEAGAQVGTGRSTSFDLFAAYGRVKARTQPAMHVVAHRSVMTLEDAIQRVSALIGQALDWTTLEAFLPVTADPQYRRSALASSFVAALELARQGRLELEQQEPFAELLVRNAA